MSTIDEQNKEIGGIDSRILENYLISHYREEYLEGSLSPRSIEIIKDTYSFHVYSSAAYVGESINTIKNTILEMLKNK